MVVTPSFWQGKRVFLTGHTGFKGSWLSLWLQQLGAEITGFSLLPPTDPSLFALAHVEQGMTSIIGDIRDSVSLLSAMRDAAPEIVIHMAAQSLVRLSYVEPVETYSTNVMGTVNVLEAVRQIKSVRAVVNVTSDKCYENKEWLWGYREDEAMGGFDPYSSSKGCAELITKAYQNSFFHATKYDQHQVALASARAGNVIGGGDWAHNRLVPDIITAFENQQAVQIRNPDSIRPWQHVLEPLRGYLVLAERLYVEGSIFAGGWNFGPYSEDVQAVEWIVQQLAQKWSDGASWQIDRNAHPHEATYLKLDISKAEKHLNWRPVLRLDQTLDLIVEWAREKQKGTNLRALTQEQIRNYQTLALAAHGT